MAKLADALVSKASAERQLSVQVRLGTPQRNSNDRSFTKLPVGFSVYTHFQSAISKLQSANMALRNLISRRIENNEQSE